MKKNIISFLVIFVLLCSGLSNAGQKDDGLCNNIDIVTGYASHVFSVDEDDSKKLTEYCNLYYGIKEKDPDYINDALNPIIERSNGLAFLKDIDFNMKTFEAKDGENGLGFSYYYHKTNKLTDYQYNSPKNLTTGMSWNVSAKGNVAFDNEINPTDFIDTRFSISGFRDYGGVSKVATDSIFELLNDLDDLATGLEGEALLQNRRHHKEIVSTFFSTQFYIDYDINAGLESNQRFTQKQWTYGANIAIDIKSYGKNSQLASLNIFDYPFAFIRILTGYDNTSVLTPLGSTFPTFVIGIDHVDPIDNDIRSAAGAEGKFERYKGEIYFRTPITKVGSQDVYINLDFRYWKEIDPIDSIKLEGIDEFDYTTLSISGGNGVYISYSEGRLPFDFKDRQVYELGWKFNFI